MSFGNPLPSNIYSSFCCFSVKFIIFTCLFFINCFYSSALLCLLFILWILCFSCCHCYCCASFLLSMFSGYYFACLLFFFCCCKKFIDRFSIDNHGITFFFCYSWCSFAAMYDNLSSFIYVSEFCDFCVFEFCGWWDPLWRPLITINSIGILIFYVLLFEVPDADAEDVHVVPVGSATKIS